MKKFLLEISGDYQNSIEYDNKEDIYVRCEPVIEYEPLDIMNILTNVSSGFLILKKSEKGFIIVEAQEKEFNMTGTDNKDVIGCYYHETHPIYAQAGFEEIFEITYET